MSYGDYLALDQLLSAQKPLTGQHDELLFITIHHVQELWLKLMLHELALATDCIRRDELRPAFKATARISRIQRQLVEAWDVLTTMTPHDYLAFREQLGSASGFQSLQYRLLEFRMGAKDPFMMKPHAHRPEAHAALQQALEAPSVYDEALRLLARRGHPIPAEVLARDVCEAAPVAPSRGRRLGRDLLRRRGGDGPLRAGRGAGGPGGQLRHLALPPHADGGADHRPPPRHRRLGRRCPT